MILNELFRVIQDRKKKMPQDSYVTCLLKQGKGKICQKVTEEADEVVYAVKKEGKQRVIEEVADLWFHSLVLLAALNLTPDQVFKELAKRKK